MSSISAGTEASTVIARGTYVSSPAPRLHDVGSYISGLAQRAVTAGSYTGRTTLTGVVGSYAASESADRRSSAATAWRTATGSVSTATGSIRTATGSIRTVRPA